MTTATPVSTTKQAARYALDASHSSATFAVRHLMISNVRGEFQKLSGWAELDPKHPEGGKVDVAIEVASINTRDDKRDAHLRSKDFFDVEVFPTITFSSKGVKRKGDGFELTGDLTIHGTKREVVVVVDELGEQVDPWGNKRIGATAKTKIKRSDFGMTWNAALEAGGVVVGDEVSIALEVEFVKQA